MRSPSSTHMLRRASIAALTALTLLASPVRAAEPAATSPEEAAKFEKARTLYVADQYLPAAEIFEDLHATTQNPQYLYYAGLAREGAGHEAHAIRHWQTALTLGLDPEFKPKAETRLAQAKARTAAVTVTVDPPGLATGATLELTPASGNRKTISVPLADLPVHLDPGDWTIKLTPQNPAYSPEELLLNVPRGTQQISQKFAPKAVLHPVIFEITPKPSKISDRGIKVTFKDPDGLTPDQPIQVSENPFTANLRPGTWHYTLESPGHPPITNTFTVTADTSIVPIPLTSDRPEPNALLAKPTRKKLALGLGVSSIAPIIPGAVFTRLASQDNGTLSPQGIVATSIRTPSDRYLGGVGLIGGGVGLMIGAALASAPISRRGWYATLGTGISVGVVGLAWNTITYATMRFPQLREPDNRITPEQWSDHKLHIIPSAALIGLGAGIVVSATAALLTERSARKNNRVKLHFNHSGFKLHF